MQKTVELLKEIFKNIDPNTELGIEEHDKNSCTVYGPFPTFMLLVEGDLPVRALVHVNADAPNMAFIFSEIGKQVRVEFDGAFAIDQDTSRLLMNEDAYLKKEENILMFAEEIKARRSNDQSEPLYVPEQKKIILAS
jgi:hypothetical protein